MVVNSHPVKSEMSVATPKSAAKEPIAFDIILVCRKQPFLDTNPKRERGTSPTGERGSSSTRERGAADIDLNPQRFAADTNPKRQRGTLTLPTVSAALDSARAKIGRLLAAGFALSRNDRKIILYGQLLTTLTAARDATTFAALVGVELSRAVSATAPSSHRPQQQILFERV